MRARLPLPLLLPMLLACTTQPLRSQPSSEAANAHACELFQLFRQMTPGNFCFSPYSSQQMAALLTAASRGETQAGLAKLAHLGADPAAGLRNAGSLQATLANSARKGALTLETATSLWAADATVYDKTFADSARTQFGASLEKLPAGGNAIACAAAVNRWVRGKTRDRVPQIIGPAAFAHPGQSVVAVNTVYMHGQWSQPFQPKLTQLRPFHTAQQGDAMRPSMTMPEGRFWYGESESFQCLGMPLAGDEASLIIVLPRSESLRPTLETRLTPASWKAVLHDIYITDVNAQVPRFSYSTQLSLKGLWQTLGAQHVFEPGMADLSAALKLPGGFVSDVIHETTIEVNEVGAIAAAATAAPADPFGDKPESERPPPPRVKSFIANRPFLWMLRHHSTDLILFMGRYAGE